MSNTRIWDRVKVTDPKYTKRVNQRGGFTTVCAMSRVMKATEIFGPIGVGWGVSWERAEAPEGVFLALVEVWYLDPESGARGAVFQYGASEWYQGRDKRLDTDAPKKAVTDGVTKCLSLLGFSADVFLGLYDDNKYVQWASEHARKPVATTEVTPSPRTQAGAGTPPSSPAADYRPPAPAASTPSTSGPRRPTKWARAIIAACKACGVEPAKLVGDLGLPPSSETAEGHYQKARDFLHKQGVLPADADVPDAPAIRSSTPPAANASDGREPPAAEAAGALPSWDACAEALEACGVDKPLIPGLKDYNPGAQAPAQLVRRLSRAAGDDSDDRWRQVGVAQLKPMPSPTVAQAVRFALDLAAAKAGA